MTSTSGSRRKNSSRNPTREKASSTVQGAAEGLGESLLALATEQGLDVGAVSRRLTALRRLYGPEVHARFIHLISHLDLGDEEARDSWRGIVHHARSMGSRLGREVDFRIALADYFVHEKPRIRHPKLIEIHLFHQTEAGNLKDGLTGLYNFRYLNDALPRELSQARRLGACASLVFLDIDNFKAFNDRLGHSQGNEALLKVTTVIRETVRDMDLACRFGGEEFAVLLPATGKAGGLVLAERLVRNVESLQIPHPGPGAFLTVSAGLATYPDDADGPEALLKAADKAMYLAKAHGKNRALSYSAEKRMAPRFAVTFRGTATTGQGADLAVAGKDISRGGLYFLVPRSIPPGTEVDLALEFGEAARPVVVHCRARVVRALSLGDGAAGIGVALTHIRPADSLRFFEILDRQKNSAP